MSSSVLKKFLKDILLYAFFFYGGVVLLLLYFNLEVEGGIDFVYPILLSTFLFLVFILIQFTRYIRFEFVLRGLKSGAQGDDLSTFGLDQQQKETILLVLDMKKQATDKEHKLRIENQEKYKIISQIVHNIKTPSSIVDLLLQNYKENGNLEINKIDRENRAINDNLDQILNYMRMDYFEKDYKVEEVDLLPFLRDKINLRKESFIYNHIYPKITTELQNAYVLTDKKWNGIIIEQIISNAIKYTELKEEGFITFHITKKLDKIILEMIDTGIGISQSDLKRVFDPFFTGENGRTVKSSSGIGLYLCKKIAKELNHKIEIASEKGVGTTVSITYLTKM